MATLLLFDVDGVLIQPNGYKIALRDTVNHFARRMGQADVDLTFTEIAAFEAYGLTNEWDAAALCVGAFLVDALLLGPHTYRDSFETTLNTILTAGLDVPRPDFIGLAQEVAARNVNHEAVTPFSHEILRDRLPADQQAVLLPLFEDIFSLDTPTTRIQQTHTLGHQRYFETYGVSAPYEDANYLMVHDRPLLSEKNRDRLLAWRQPHQRDFCIFTARPSLPPEGTRLGYAPEADMAAELLGLVMRVPIIGAGRLQWLAERYNRNTADYIKPYPTQALAAIGAALSQTEVPALEAAASLVERDQLQAPLADLAAMTSEVVVFEDSVGGILAVQRAVDLLHQHGAIMTMRSIGVAANADKRAALSEVADVVVHDVNLGINLLLGD